MKPRHFVAFGIVVLFVALALGGCGFLGTDIPTRIGDFVTSLNGDRTQTYTNLVADSAIWTANQGSTSLWDTHFPSSDGTYSSEITSTAPYDATGVFVDITPSGTGIPLHCEFVLTNTGGTATDYYISNILIESSSTYTSIFGI